MAAVVDVFVYLVVLNLFVEYFPQVLSETFTLSFLTAVLLKGVLEVVIAAKEPGEGPVSPSLHPARRSLPGSSCGWCCSAASSSSWRPSP